MPNGQLVTTGLSALAPDYRAVFCDIWGVLHNGVTPHLDAVAALRRYRDGGGRVILISNAARPAPQIVEMLADMGIGEDVYDRIVTSGDVTRELVRAYSGRIIHFVGPNSDHPMLKGINVGLGDPDEAAAVVITGLENPDETPAAYTERLNTWIDHRLPLICANPDITVEVGDKMIFCAGAIAEDYARMGGKVEMAGKPHPPIYEVAFRLLEELVGAEDVDRKSIVAIGDAVRTDALGAARYGIDFLFITGSLHAEELNAHEGADEAQVVETVAPSRANLVGYMPRLKW